MFFHPVIYLTHFIIILTFFINKPSRFFQQAILFIPKCVPQVVYFHVRIVLATTVNKFKLILGRQCQIIV